MKEVWKDISGFEGLYKVSNIGNVLSNGRNSKLTSKHNQSKGGILKPARSSTGYLHVQLYKNRKAYTCNIHKLVASAFIQNPQNKSQINHIDGDKSNNSVDNLEWVTASENQLHSIAHGLREKSPMTGRKGKNNPNSKTVLQYTTSGTFVKEWHSIADISRHYNCNASTISACVNGNIKTAKGYIWIAKNDDLISKTIFPVVYKKRKRRSGIVNAKTVPVNQFSLSGDFIKEWKSVSEVSRFLNCSRYIVNKCCQGSIRSIGGFSWKYSSSS